MAYPIRVLPQVEGEIVEAMAWYEARSPGLGPEFYRAYVGALSVIADGPTRHRKVRGEVRRVIVRRFPYAVFYIFDGAEVVVLSCLHESRSPEAWPQ